MIDPDACARSYMRDVQSAMDSGYESGAGMATSLLAHIFPETSNELRDEVLAFLPTYHAYLKEFEPRDDTPIAIIDRMEDMARFYFSQEHWFMSRGEGTRRCRSVQR
jgi:hypothetical protein